MKLFFFFLHKLTFNGGGKREYRGIIFQNGIITPKLTIARSQQTFPITARIFNCRMKSKAPDVNFRVPSFINDSHKTRFSNGKNYHIIPIDQQRKPSIGANFNLFENYKNLKKKNQINCRV